jgi:hypothetical protein
MGLLGQALAQDLPQLNLKSKIQTQTQARKFQGHLKLTLEGFEAFFIRSGLEACYRRNTTPPKALFCLF